jgi:hypothetical protein
MAFELSRLRLQGLGRKGVRILFDFAMAEEALYGNPLEPKFPFHLVAPRLVWLPAYLSAANTSPSTESSHLNSATIPLIDVVLVLARARTSAMHSMEHFTACHSLATLLNAELQAIGEEARYHRLEIVRRGSSLFFVTCVNSARFNWRTHLTHLDVGRNLDYLAAGHVFSPPYPPRALCQFIERTSMKRVAGEFALLEALDDDVVRQRLVDFNNTKQALFNDVMERFGLRYRFKSILITSQAAERAHSVVTANGPPPDKDWWEENCIFVDGAGMSGIPPALRSCTFDSKFHRYWPLIQHMHRFLPKYYWLECRSIAARSGPEYWATGDRIFANVRRFLVEDRTNEEFQSFFERVRMELDDLLKAAGVTSREISQKPGWLVEAKHVFAGYVNSWVALPSLILEEIKLRTFQRWKLRTPLIYDAIPAPKGSKADVYLF